MGWLGGRPRRAVIGAAIAVFAGAACFGGPPPPPLPPPPPPPPAAEPCQSAGAASQSAGKDEPARPPSDQAIPPEEAGAQAREVSSTTEVRTKTGEIPLVTVEERGGEPQITTTTVRSPDEAEAVAEQKAADGDLVAVDVDKPVRASADPNDQLFGQQWAFTRVPYVNAWAADGTQGAGVTVAVIDTGVQGNHPDLSGQVLTGAHFLHSDNGEPVEPGAGGTDDSNGHGTHVSGTIAAKSNNTTGVSGAAPAAQILPVKVLCADGGGFSSDVADGIVWAVDNGADVINLSLGGGPTSAEQAAIEHARDNNVLVVAAGGNDGANGPASYPAAYSATHANVIAVAATDNADGHPAYGTSGANAGYLDVSAPGGCGSPCGGGSANDVLSTVNNSGYGTKVGTSMATPHVSAAAALLRAANGACTAAQVRTRLRNTAADLGPSGEDSTFGTGIVNPVAAGTSCT
jgi:subtilisin family serine protease